MLLPNIGDDSGPILMPIPPMVVLGVASASLVLVKAEFEILDLASPLI